MFWGSGAMPLRYAGVTRPLVRGKRCWVAQQRSPRIWKACFQSQNAAARWLASQLGVELSTLKHDSSGVLKRLPAARYHGVVVRIKRGRGALFEARAGGCLLKTCSSELAAARAVAKACGTTVKKLRKKDAEVFTKKLARSVFAATCSVFGKYHPGDLQHLELQETSCKTVFREESRSSCVRVSQ